MPYTGAFLYALCPRCRTPVVIARAVRAPPPASSGAAFPSAADTDRAPRRAAPPALSHPLPPAALLQNELPPPPPSAHIVQRLARGSTVVGVAIVIALLLNNVLVLLVSTPSVFEYAATHSSPSVQLLFAFPFPIEVASFGGPAAASWHLVMVGAILLSVGTVFRRHLKEAADKVLGVLQTSPAPTLSEPNGLFVMARLFSVSLLVNLVVASAAALAGQSPRVPEGLENSSDLSIYIGLANASVWEELVTRVLLLGIPLLLIHRAGRGRLEQPWTRYIFGGRVTLDGPAVALLVFSAAVFGVAHVPGYDIWKLPPTLFAGLALGYLFLRYGLAAAISMHFLTDYLFASTLWFSGATGYLLILDVCFVALLIIGVANAGRYLLVLFEAVRARRIPPYLGGPAIMGEAAPPQLPPEALVAPVGPHP